MARRTFFSFHYQRDIWRVNQVRNSNKFEGSAAAGWTDASIWEEAKRKGEATVKRLIDTGLQNTSVTVVCIGAKTAGRTYINYEIEQSIACRNGILGLRIHHLMDRDRQVDPPGEVPRLLAYNDIPIMKFTTTDELGKWIEQAAARAGR